MAEQRLDPKEKRFGSVVVRTWTKPKTGYWDGYWFFACQKDGENERSFSGVPNYCSTRHSALMRGYYRAKWLISGEFYKRYK